MQNHCEKYHKTNTSSIFFPVRCSHIDDNSFVMRSTQACFFCLAAINLRMASSRVSVFIFRNDLIFNAKLRIFCQNAKEKTFFC